MEQSKRCSVCKQVLPLDAFGAKAGNKDGLTCACRPCGNAQKRAWVRAHPDSVRATNRRQYEQNREARRAYEVRWRAENHERVRANNQRRRADPETRRADKERNRQYYQANHERLIVAQRESGRRYYQRNKAASYARKQAGRLANPGRDAEYARRRRALKLATAVAEISPDLLAGKLAYWGHRCWMCGGEPEAWDHVKPLSKGGPHMLANLRPACRVCNSVKNAKWQGVSAALSHRSPGTRLFRGGRVSRVARGA